MKATIRTVYPAGPVMEAHLTREYPEDGINEGLHLQIEIRVPLELMPEAVTVERAIMETLTMIFEERPRAMEEAAQEHAAQALAKARGS